MQLWVPVKTMTCPNERVTAAACAMQMETGKARRERAAVSRRAVRARRGLGGDLEDME